MMSYRLIIIGSSCSGKTTLGANLGKQMGLKHIDLDDLHWLPNWQHVDMETLRQKISDEIEGVEGWVITGAYSQTWTLTMPKATHVVFVDLPLSIVLYRFFTRTFRRMIKKEECCNGNTESWKTIFAKDSLLLWILKNYTKKRPQFLALQRDNRYPHLKFIHLKSRKDVQNLTSML